MIALFLCLVSIFTRGLSQTFPLFNSSFALPKPHSSPDLKSQCSVQVVFADDARSRLTTWSPEQNCQVQSFTYPPFTFPENIYQCSNGLTVIKGVDTDGFTELLAYNGGEWERIKMPARIRDVTNYAVATIPNLSGLFLVGGKVEFQNDGFIQTEPLNNICVLDCFAYLNDGNKDGSAWICFDKPNVLCSKTYDSCATSSNEYLTVVNGKTAPSVPNNDVGFYPAFGRPRTCKSDAVDFAGGVQDCISPKISQVYAIGTKKLYLMNPAKGSVKQLKSNLPVMPTPEIPARLYYTPENSALNIIGGTEKGDKPSCRTYYYAKNKWKPGVSFPCEAGRVLGTL